MTFILPAPENGQFLAKLPKKIKRGAPYFGTPRKIFRN